MILVNRRVCNLFSETFIKCFKVRVSKAPQSTKTHKIKQDQDRASDSNSLSRSNSIMSVLDFAELIKEQLSDTE